MSRLYFFYGSLRPGFWNHKHIEGEEFVGEGKTTGKFRMFVVAGGVPYIVKAEEGYPIIGDVFNISEEREPLLYMLEQGYTSDKFDILLNNGQTVSATIFYANPITFRFGYLTVGEVTSGDYTRVMPKCLEFM